jgi:hypothetical protein
MIRDTTGKIYRRGIDSKIEFASICGLAQRKDLDIKKPSEALQNGGHLKVLSNTGAGAIKWTRNLKLYLTVKAALKRNGNFVKDTSKRERHGEDLTKLYSPRDFSTILNAELLKLVSTGTVRLDKYFSKWYIRTYQEAKRSTKTVDLAAIISTGKKGYLVREKIIALGTSLKLKEILTFTKAQLLNELVKLRPYVRRGFPSVDKNSKHEPIAKALAAVRKKVFDRRPEMKAEFEAKAMEEYESLTSVELRKKELAHRLYSTKIELAVTMLGYEP